MPVAIVVGVPFGANVWEIAIIALVLVLVFGPKRLPELARSLGKGVRELREPVDEVRSSFTLEDEPAEKKPDSAKTDG